MKFKVTMYIPPNKNCYFSLVNISQVLILNILLISSSMTTNASEKFSWQIATPESKGLDSKILRNLHKEFEELKHGYINSFIVIKRNAIVFEEYYDIDYAELTKDKKDEQIRILEKNYGVHANPMYNYFNPEWHPYYKDTDLHTIQSVTKSVTSALLGIAIDKGYISDIDSKIVDFFPDYASSFKDKKKQSITIRNLLIMSSGMKWDESTHAYTDPRNDAANMENSEFWLEYILSASMDSAPGDEFNYNSGITILLSQILEQATGTSVESFAKKYLFSQLGIDKFFWKKIPDGLTDTESGLYISARDFARIGLLFANKGQWMGKEIISEDWINEIMAPTILTNYPNTYYGFQWWLYSDVDNKEIWMQAGIGYGGQHILIIPKYDLLLIFNGWNVFDIERPTSEYLAERVIDAVIEY